MLARMSRRVGNPTAAVIRRTWRFRPSVISNCNQWVGTVLRKRTGGSRAQRLGGSSIATTFAGSHEPVRAATPGEKPDGCEAAEFRAVPGPLATHLALT